jgi:hypothetical protein
MIEILIIAACIFTLLLLMYGLCTLGLWFIMWAERKQIFSNNKKSKHEKEVQNRSTRIESR